MSKQGQANRCSWAIRCILAFMVVMSGYTGVAGLPLGDEHGEFKAATLDVDASRAKARRMPDTLFGVFFEEINHAGAGGLWAELVNNRGFEAGGNHTPSSISPWSIIGDKSSILVATDRTSCFSRNIVALRMEVLCNDCPAGGVGIYC